MVRTDLELTYHLVISQEGPDAHPLYSAIKHSIEWIGKKHQVTSPMDLKYLIEEEFGIKIGAVEYLTNTSGNYRYRISFRDERHYTWFMLRWS